MNELKSNNNLLEMGDDGSDSGSDSDPSGDDLPPAIMKKIMRKEKVSAASKSKPPSPNLTLARKNGIKQALKTAEKKKQKKEVMKQPVKSVFPKKLSYKPSAEPRRNSIFNLPRLNRNYTPTTYSPIGMVDCGTQTDKEPSYTLT
jgi:hypothetical protein